MAPPGQKFRFRRKSTLSRLPGRVDVVRGQVERDEIGGVSALKQTNLFWLGLASIRGMRPASKTPPSIDPSRSSGRTPLSVHGTSSFANRIPPARSIAASTTPHFNEHRGHQASFNGCRRMGRARAASPIVHFTRLKWKQVPGCCTIQSRRRGPGEVQSSS